MLIDAYKKKYNWYFNFYKFIYRFRILLLTILVSLSTTSITLMSLKGKVVDNILVSNEIVYGEKLNYESKGLLSDYIHYEFKDSSGIWSKIEPTDVGNYEIRGVSKNIFNKYRYGKSHSFKIIKRPIEVEFKDSKTIYGEKKNTYIADLAYQDSIIYHEFKYESLDSSSLKAIYTPIKESIVINNKEGKDVTQFYDISIKSNEVNLTKRVLKYETDAKSKVYDGTPLYNKDYKNITNLYNKDRISEVTSYKSITTQDKVINELSFKIVNENNIDVSNFYTLSISKESTLEITKKDLIIETLSDYKIYDGKELKKESYKFNDSTSLVKGDTLSITYPSIIYYGTIENKPISYSIINKDNKDVTSSYNITWIYGNLTINKRNLTIKTNSLSTEYDSYIHQELSYSIVKGSLASNDYININDSESSSIKYVDNKENILSFSFYNDKGIEVTSSYEINLISGTLSIYKRKITLFTSSKSFTYDGNYHSFLNIDIISGSLGDNDELAYKSEGSTSEKDIGSYKNIVNYYINNKDDNIDATSSYQISISYGTLTINKANNGGNSNGNGNNTDDDSNNPGNNPGGNIPGENGGNDMDSASNMDAMAGFDNIEEGEPLLAFTYISTTSNAKYFRDNSFKDYLNGELTDDKEYKEKDENYGNPNFTLVSNLKNKNIDNLKITYKMDGSKELVPMYSKINDKLTDYKNNVSYERKRISSWEVLEYDYLNEGTVNLTKNLSYSEDYINFVYDNYLVVGNKTKNKLNEWLFKQDFIKYNKDKSINIYETSVALHKYFESNFIYQKEDLDNDSDYPVEDFLLNTHKGYCNYFATASMLIYRMLGIPSRVAGGYLGVGSANIETEVTTESAHAWTEIFLDDYGWIYIDNTVGNNSDDNADSDSNNETIDGDLIIKSSSNEFTYDGTYHNDTKYAITKNTLSDDIEIIYNNYTKIKEVGTKENDFEILLKIDGKMIDYENDSDIKVVKDKGNLKVNPRPLKVTTPSITKTSGSILSSEKKITDSYLNGLAKGDTLGEVIYISSISKKGSIDNIVIIKSILDSDNNNVISNYDINYEYGKLTIE